jgi:hypothetical protein
MWSKNVTWTATTCCSIPLIVPPILQSGTRGRFRCILLLRILNVCLQRSSLNDHTTLISRPLSGYGLQFMANYHRLATLIGTHPELALFRRFAISNAKNLLYLQSELVHLESELKCIAREDQHSGDCVKKAFDFSVFDLKEASGTDHNLQWRKTLEMREKLKEYSMF